MPNNVLKNLKPSIIKNELVSLEFDPEKDWNVKTVIIKSLSGTLMTQTIVAKFPNWRRVLPRETSKEPGYFDPELLAKFIKVAKAFGKKPDEINLHQNGTSAAALTINDIENFLGVVMPMRNDSVYTGCSRFLDEKPVTHEALAA